MRLRLPSRWLIVGSAVLALVTVMFWLLPEALAATLKGERGLIERSSAILYVAAGLGFLWAALHARGLPKVFAVSWALLAIVCAGEETSWLQHELGYVTPAAIADANVQGEFNLHNLRGLHGGALLGEEKISPAIPYMSAQNIFQIGLVAYFLLLPIATLAPGVRRLAARVSLPYLSPEAVLVVWTPIATAAALAFVSSGVTKQLLAETREFHYSVAFVLLAVMLVLHVRATSPARRLHGARARAVVEPALSHGITALRR